MKLQLTTGNECYFAFGLYPKKRRKDYIHFSSASHKEVKRS